MPGDRETAFPDLAENSLLALNKFLVRSRREFASTGAESLGNPTRFGTETARKRRKSLYLPGDQGIGLGDEFAMDSLLRHVVRGGRDFSREFR